jgi:hypothetical protein
MTAPETVKPTRALKHSRVATHYLFRVGDGDHFKASSSKGIWGILSSTVFGKGFLAAVKPGDVLWFVKGERSKGLLLAAATFVEVKERVLGPLISLTATNEELGWTKTDGDWDVEVHFKDLYNIEDCELHSEIKGSATIRQYNDLCMVNLPQEYANIVRYSKVSRTM